MKIKTTISKKSVPDRMFTLNEEDIKLSNRDAILQITKIGDLVSTTILEKYLDIPYTSIFACMQDLTKQGYFEFIGKRKAPSEKGGVSSKTNVYRRLDNSS